MQDMNKLYSPAARESQSPQVPRERLNANFGLLKWIIFSAFTFGIYSMYTTYRIAHDVNIACEKDGKHTAGLLMYILLTFVTFGIYSFVWRFKVCNRIEKKLERCGLASPTSGIGDFLWNTFGLMLFGLGALIAQYKLFKGINMVDDAYNSGK